MNNAKVNSNRKTLVLGATGKTGRRVAKKLQQMNIPVRAGSRKGTPPFDWEKPDNWEKGLNNIQKVYITFQPDFAVPGALEKIQLFVDTAKQSGVQKLVLLSGRGEPEAEEGEYVVMDSGLSWTIVRASWFMQNFSEYFFLDFILGGHIIVPETKALEPFVDVDDIADVAVAALTDDKHNGKIYELTGPELLSIKEATAMISESINRPIAYQEVSIQKFLKILRDHQVPKDYMWLMEYLFTEILDGRNESLTGDVKKVLGREPGTFAEYVNKAKKTGVWNV